MIECTVPEIPCRPPLRTPAVGPPSALARAYFTGGTARARVGSMEIEFTVP